MDIIDHYWTEDSKEHNFIHRVHCLSSGNLQANCIKKDSVTDSYFFKDNKIYNSLFQDTILIYIQTLTMFDLSHSIYVYTVTLSR